MYLYETICYICDRTRAQAEITRLSADGNAHWAGRASPSHLFWITFTNSMGRQDLHFKDNCLKCFQQTSKWLCKLDHRPVFISAYILKKNTRGIHVYSRIWLNIELTFRLTAFLQTATYVSPWKPYAALYLGTKWCHPETALLLCMALLFVVSASTYNYYPVVQAAAAYNKLDIKYVNKTPIYTVVNVKHLTDHNWKYSSFWRFYLQNTSWENYLFHMPGDSQTEEIHSNTPDMGDRNSPMSTEASML